MTGFWGGTANFCVWEAFGEIIRLLLSSYALESLTVTSPSFTRRSRTVQYVCLSIWDQPHTVIISRHFIKDVSFDSVTAFKNCLRVEALWVEQESGWVWNNTLLLGITGCENAPSVRRERKKTCCFLTLSYCCFNCDFQYVMIVCEGKWRSSVQEQSCTVNSVLTDPLCRLCWCLRERHMVLYTLVSNVPCYVFLGGIVPQLQMWNLNLTFLLLH